MTIQDFLTEKHAGETKVAFQRLMEHRQILIAVIRVLNKLLDENTRPLGEAYFTGELPEDEVAKLFFGIEFCRNALDYFLNQTEAPKSKVPGHDGMMSLSEFLSTDKGEIIYQQISKALQLHDSRLVGHLAERFLP